jgi:hypothetical protein
VLALAAWLILPARLAQPLTPGLCSATFVSVNMAHHHLHVQPAEGTTPPPLPVYLHIATAACAMSLCLKANQHLIKWCNLHFVNASLSICAMAIVKTCTADLSIHQLWPQAHSHRFAPLLCSSTSFDHTGLTLGATRAGVKVDEDSVTALGQKLSAVGIGIAMIILSAHLNMGSLCFSTSGKRINSTPPSHASLAQSPAVQRAVTLIVFSLSSRWRQHNHCRTTLSCFHVSFFNATDHSSRVANWYLAHDCTHRVRWSQD